MSLSYRTLATSNHPLIVAARGLRQRVRRFSLPAPRVVVLPLLWVFLMTRAVYYFLKRVLICEPMFKAYCTRYGYGVRTGVFIHWIQGKGRILLGDRVHFDGKSSITFAARFADHPTLQVGDDTGISHNCTITVAKLVQIGRHCRIASDVFLFDSSGHARELEPRRAGLPPADEDVRPIFIGDDVWIGRRCIVFPGVTIGEGSIVSSGSVVMSDVAPMTIVAGNPARKIGVVPRGRELPPSANALASMTSAEGG